MVLGFSASRKISTSHSFRLKILEVLSGCLFNPLNFYHDGGVPRIYLAHGSEWVLTDPCSHTPKLPVATTVSCLVYIISVPDVQINFFISFFSAVAKVLSTVAAAATPTTSRPCWTATTLAGAEWRIPAALYLTFAGLTAVYRLFQASSIVRPSLLGSPSTLPPSSASPICTRAAVLPRTSSQPRRSAGHLASSGNPCQVAIFNQFVFSL